MGFDKSSGFFCCTRTLRRVEWDVTTEKALEGERYQHFKLRVHIFDRSTSLNYGTLTLST